MNYLFKLLHRNKRLSFSKLPNFKIFEYNFTILVKK